MYYFPFKQRYQRNSVEGLKERQFWRKVNRYEGNLKGFFAQGKGGKRMKESSGS